MIVEIKDLAGNIRFCTPLNKGSKRKFLLMKEDYVTLKFSLDHPVSFELGDCIDNELGQFELVDPYKPSYNKSTGGYDYDLRLDAYYRKWKNKIFKYLPAGSGGEASWSLTAPLEKQLQVYERNLAALGYTYRGVAFKPLIDGSVEKKSLPMTYTNTNLLDALTQMAEAWDCEWWVEENRIRFGRCEYSDPVDFELGVNVEEMTASDSQTPYATRIYAFGSTRNVPGTYRKELVFDVKSLVPASGGSSVFCDTGRPIDPSYFPLSAITKAPDSVRTLSMTQGTSGIYSSAQTFTGNSSPLSLAGGEYTLSLEDLQRTVRFEPIKGPANRPVEFVKYKAWLTYRMNGEDKSETLADSQFYVHTYGADIEMGVEDKVLFFSGAVTDLRVHLSFTPVFKEVKDVRISYTMAGACRLSQPNPYDSALACVTFVSGANAGKTYSATLNATHSEGDAGRLRLEPGVPVSLGDRYTIGNIVKSKVPSSYFTVDVEEALVLNGVVEKRLMLPEGIPYIDAVPGLATTRAVEQVVVFEDVYPHLLGTMSTVVPCDSTIKNDDGTTSPQTLYRFTDSGLRFSKDYKMEKEDLKITFQSGDLNGMSFGVKFNPLEEDETNAKGEWNAKAQLWEIIPNEDYGLRLPDVRFCPKPGNTYILSGYDPTYVDEHLISSAEGELQEKAEKYLAKIGVDSSTYTCKMLSSAQLNEDGSPQLLEVGARVKLINPVYFASGSRQSRILGFEYNLDIAYDSPVYTVGETSSYSRLGELESKVDSLTYRGLSYTSGGTAVGGGGVYVIGVNDKTLPGDRNTFSAKRTLAEISDRALSRTRDDRTSGEITFEAGLVSEGFARFSSGVLVRSPQTPAELRSMLSSSLLEDGEDLSPLTISDVVIEENPDISLLSDTLLETSSEGASSLGGLTNVEKSADGTSSTSDLLLRPAGEKSWSPTPFSWMETFQCVSTPAERDALPANRLRVPTVCYVGSEDCFYKWTGENWELKELGAVIEGLQRNIRVVNNLEGKNLSAGYGEPCLLNFTFVSQERYSSAEPYEDTGERGLCQISVKNASADEYVVVRQSWINSGVPMSVDIAQFLLSGSNQVMVKVTGEVTEATTPSFVYSVYLTSLSLSADNFRWWTAYTGDITLPLLISGNISKKLLVTLTGDGYRRSYEESLGTGIYTETPYNYSIPHPGKSGVYELSAYVTSADGTVRTRTVSFQVICAVAGEGVKLVAINNLLPKATNWTENALFDYAFYDGDRTSTSADFVITKEGQEIFRSSESAILTSTRYTFTVPLEVDTLDNSEFTMEVNVMGEEEALTDALTFSVNNSLGFSAVSGAVFYLNPRTRNNAQSNRDFVINEMDSSSVEARWEGMSWGGDGWWQDDAGSKSLHLLSGSRVDIAYHPFAREAARTGKTIEIDYKASCVTDYTRPVLTVSTPAGDKFVGLQVYPEESVVYSSALKNPDTQNVVTYEEKRVRLALVIMPNAYGNQGLNLCIVYINGVKNREFTYEDNDYFAQNGNIVIGSDYADVDIYGIRVYDSALTSAGILRNYTNWLSDTPEKTASTERNDLMDADGAEISFERVKGKYNVFVLETPAIPSLANPNTVDCRTEVHWADHPEWDAAIDSAPVSGQGTSSMRYWRWNLRWKLAKTSKVTYADGTTSTGKWRFVPGHPNIKKATAKKNFASSMQSHKMGSVNSMDDLAREMGLSNEGDGRIAVYQYPFVGFQKTVNEEGEAVYTFIGLYTFGPDKGDDATFGYDTDRFPELLSIEGSDNAPLLALFRVPWNPAAGRVAYNPDEEALQYNGVNSWDYDAGAPDSEEEGAAVQALYEKNFLPAYNLVYECSPRLKPFEGTGEELNARVSDLRNEPYEFWVRGGDVYYYESSLGQFIPSDIGTGPINLYAQLVDKGYGLSSADLENKTLEELNTLFINARIVKFRQEAGSYFDMNDAIFQTNWVEFNAATDNRAKNTYPYIFGGLSEGYRWKWRGDDMDTIWPITNQGESRKGYWVEVGDSYENGGPVWNGETSNFWNLIELAFPEEVKAGMRRMMSAMEKLGGLGSGTSFDKLYAYFDKYYFSAAQKHFAENLYNADAKWTYENAKLAYISGRYTNDTDPMTQSLGDHYSAEMRWIGKRILYMMSKYSYGLFSASGTDSITVRAAGNTIRYELTPAMDMYPAIANGTSIIRGSRTKAGEVCGMFIELSGSGDQQNTIQGASYLQDIGDWHDKNVTGSMIVQGKRLREVRLGSKTEPVTISITSLTLSNCPSLKKLELSNISTLRGTLNLTACTHLQEVYAGGTGVSQLRLPQGGGLRRVEYSANNQYLTLSNYPLLAYEGIDISLCRSVITDFFIVDCPLLDPVRILVDIMDAQESQGESHALKRVRAVGFDATYHTSGMLDKLARLADGSYQGLNSDGVAGEDAYPVLDGTLNVYANAYEDSIEALRGKFKALVLNVIGKFYIHFRDKTVNDICVSNWGDGEGVTKEAAAQVTAIGTKFSQNLQITSFDEFQYFTGIREKAFPKGFYKCSNLKSIIFPPVSPGLSELAYACFEGCDLREFDIPPYITVLGANLFMDNANLSKVTGVENVRNVYNAAFSRTAIKTVTFHPETTAIPDYVFDGCKHMENFTVPSKVVSIGMVSFRDCEALEWIKLLPEVPPTLGYGCLGGTTCTFYVPQASLEAYRTATGWAPFASRIVGY